jgi:hypothetical protein
MLRSLHSIVTGLLVLFFVIMLVFRLIDGSFESAGERMDRLMGVTGSEISDAAEGVADATGDVVDDLADGRDAPN